MNTRDLILIHRASRERREIGYITDKTRASLMDLGYTAEAIESALLKMERTNGF